MERSGRQRRAHESDSARPGKNGLMKQPFAVMLALLIVNTYAYAHGGGLDSCGGHHDRKRGGYHVHDWQAYCACHTEDAQCESRFDNTAPSDRAKDDKDEGKSQRR